MVQNGEWHESHETRARHEAGRRHETRARHEADPRAEAGPARRVLRRLTPVCPRRPELEPEFFLCGTVSWKRI